MMKLLSNEIRKQFVPLPSPRLLGGALLLGTSSMVCADLALEEVVVTAQKRAESIQDVPISMQAMSGDELQELGVSDSKDIMKLMPNVNLSSASANNANFFIRGVGTDDFHINKVSAVGVYLDEVSINSPFGAAFSLFDMERVEVMRGPQNTLFGRNTTGGAVNFISRTPDPEDGVNGYLQGTFGRYQQQDFEGALGVALSDQVAARLSVSSKSGDGIWVNQTTGETDGGREKHSARFQLRWLTENTDVLWNVHSAVNRGEGTPNKTFGLLDSNNLSQACASPGPDSSSCALGDGFVPDHSDWNDAYSGEKARENIDLWGTSVKLDWELDALTFTSVTSYDATEVARNDDSDGSPGLMFQFYQENELEQWSQELRLASDGEGDFRWIAGLYYFLEESDYATAVRRTPNPALPSTPGSMTVIPATVVLQENEVYSLYGQGEYDLTDRLKLTLGLRWSNETKEGGNATSVGNGLFLPDEDVFVGFDAIAISVDDGTPNGVCPPPVGGLPCENPLEKLDGDWEEWGGRFSLDYQLTEETMVYTSVSRGFKGGGFSVAALQGINGLSALAVEPEILTAYEIGGKTALLDNRLQVNGAIFYYDWEDMQSFQVLDGLPQLLNVPSTSLTGAEVEMKFVPAEGWLVQLGAGWLDAEIDDAGGITGVANGNNITHTPELSANGMLRKDIPWGEGTLTFQADFRYVDEVDTVLSNWDLMKIGSHTDLNARISYRFGEEEQYNVALWGKNLTDEEYCAGMVDLTGLAEGVQCNPSEGVVRYGLTVTAAFD